MADMMDLFLFGVLLHMFQLCCVDANGDYDNSFGDHTYGDDDHYYEGSILSGGTVAAIILGSIFLFMLKICLCYWRFKRRTTVITRTITLERTVPVSIRDSNPNHAGYNQGMTRPTSPPPYAAAIPQTVVPGQGPTGTNKDKIGTCPPPPYSERPDGAKY